MISADITKVIGDALQKLSLDVGAIVLDHPVEFAHGDYATNIALTLAKQVGKNPKALADEIANEINASKPEWLESAIAVAPGFINFTLSKKVYLDTLQRFSDKNVENTSTRFVNKKVLVEHSSPNLFKPFHIGHLMNNVIGESIARLTKAGGAHLTTVTFPSDISIGIAKAVWEIQKRGGLGNEIFNKSESEIISFLGECYVAGTKTYEEDESVVSEIKRIADILYAGTPSEELDIYTKTKEINLNYFEGITKRLGSHFDGYIFESEAGVVGKEIVQKNIGKVFTESEGAIVYTPSEERKDINTAVFLNSQGNPTYEAKDLGLLSIKEDRYHPDISIFITDAEQTSHFKVVLDAARHIAPRAAEKSLHVPHGRMTFNGKKMSSRLGGVPLVSEILGAIGDEVREKESNKTAHLDEQEKEMLVDAIAQGALRFTILKSKPGQNINFDAEKSLSFEGDSGPYLQYTFARTRSLIEKGEKMFGDIATENFEMNDLARTLVRYESVRGTAVEELAPQKLLAYLLDLAREFNSFYASNPILVEADKATSLSRLLLTQAVSTVLKDGLTIVGIEAVERM